MRMQNFQGAKTKKSILKLARLCRRFLLLDLTFAPFNFNVRHVAFRSAVAPRSVALRDFFLKVLRLESCVFFAYQRYFGFRFFSSFFPRCSIFPALPFRGRFRDSFFAFFERVWFVSSRADFSKYLRAPGFLIKPYLPRRLL